MVGVIPDRTAVNNHEEQVFRALGASIAQARKQKGMPRRQPNIQDGVLAQKGH